jgi:hypothetical protein
LNKSPQSTNATSHHKDNCCSYGQISAQGVHGAHGLLCTRTSKAPGPWQCVSVRPVPDTVAWALWAAWGERGRLAHLYDLYDRVCAVPVLVEVPALPSPATTHREEGAAQAAWFR